jgi:hypothetical protein
MAGSSGDQRNARPAIDTPESIRGMSNARLMPKIDDANTALSGHRKNIVQMIADQRKDIVNAQVQHRVDKQFRARCHSEP